MTDPKTIADCPATDLGLFLEEYMKHPDLVDPIRAAKGERAVAKAVLATAPILTTGADNQYVTIQKGDLRALWLLASTILAMETDQ